MILIEHYAKQKTEGTGRAHWSEIHVQSNPHKYLVVGVVGGGCTRTGEQISGRNTYCLKCAAVFMPLVQRRIVSTSVQPHVTSDSRIKSIS